MRKVLGKGNTSWILKNNAQSLSFIVYGLFALSLFILYNGFSTLYGNVLADFIIKQKQTVLIFNMSYGAAATLLLIGTLIFFGVRYVASQLEDKNIISPSNAIRFWILGGIVLIAALFAVIDLFTIISGVMTGRSDTINLLVTLVTLTVVSSIILFCIAETRRKVTLKFLSAKSSVFLVFCLVSFALGFFIAPPWTGRLAREDQEQLQRLQNIKFAIENMDTRGKNIPTSLEDLRSGNIKSRKDILDNVTKQPYEYKKISDSSYEICAQFLTEQDIYNLYRLYPNEMVPNEPHHKGRTCYTVQLSLKDPRDFQYND